MRIAVQVEFLRSRAPCINARSREPNLNGRLLANRHIEATSRGVLGVLLSDRNMSIQEYKRTMCEDRTAAAARRNMKPPA